MKTMRTPRLLKQGCQAGVFLLPFLSMTALGDQESDFKFLIDAAGAVITRYVGSGGVVIIPENLGGRPVRQIANGAFASSETRSSILIPTGVTTIGASAFATCT